MSSLTKNNIAQQHCYHCGDECNNTRIAVDNHYFCCEGCKMVYGILNKTGLCNYYKLNNNPGNTQKVQIRKDKFSFLDDETIVTKTHQFYRWQANQLHVIPASNALQQLPLVIRKYTQH